MMTRNWVCRGHVVYFLDHPLFLQLNNLVQSLSCLRKERENHEKIVDDQEKN
jgi:hypothetical protein